MSGMSDVTNTPTLVVGGVLAVATAPVWIPIWGVSALIGKLKSKKK